MRKNEASAPSPLLKILVAHGKNGPPKVTSLGARDKNGSPKATSVPLEIHLKGKIIVRDLILKRRALE